LVHVICRLRTHWEAIAIATARIVAPICIACISRVQHLGCPVVPIADGHRGAVLLLSLDDAIRLSAISLKGSLAPPTGGMLPRHDTVLEL
jgi:hypothetical protein